MGGVRSRGEVPESPVNSAYPSMMRLLAAVPSQRHSVRLARREPSKRSVDGSEPEGGPVTDETRAKWGLRS